MHGEEGGGSHFELHKTLQNSSRRDRDKVLCVRPAPSVLMDSDKPTAPEKLREEVARAKEHGDSTTEQPIIAVFSAREYEEAAFEAALAAEKAAEPDGKLPYAMRYIEAELNPQTVKLAQDCAAVCVFVNDGVSKEVLDWLGRYTSCRLILLRCAGFNNVDLAAAAVNKISVARVPAYSPYAVAEHAVALCMTLNRKIHKAYLRNRDGNFSLRGLTGFDMHGRTVGIIGTGNIGVIAANIFLGFGCKVIAQSRSVNKELADKGVEYVTLDELCKRCDIISLHAPMTKETHHCINEARIALMKKGVMIINTSRGGLLDTKAAIAGLKNKTIGALGLDVYEEESGLFFHGVWSPLHTPTRPLAFAHFAPSLTLSLVPAGPSSSHLVPLLHRSHRRGLGGRCFPAARQLSECHCNGPPGVSHRGCVAQHRRRDPVQHARASG